MAPERSIAVQLRRPLVVGFIIGFLVTVPMTILALMLNAAEWASDFVVPGTLLLSPLSPHMADWNGALNLGLASVANGLVYSLVVGAVAAPVFIARRR